jgi:hypothetical protein
VLFTGPIPSCLQTTVDVDEIQLSEEIEPQLFQAGLKISTLPS